jgi:hypothetical protein
MPRRARRDVGGERFNFMYAPGMLAKQVSSAQVLPACALRAQPAPQQPRAVAADAGAHVLTAASVETVANAAEARPRLLPSAPTVESLLRDAKRAMHTSEESRATAMSAHASAAQCMALAEAILRVAGA